MRKMSYGALTSSFIIIPSLMLCLSVSACVSVCLVLSLGLHRSCPALWAHFPSIASPGPKSQTKQHLDDVTDTGFRRTPDPSGERERGEGRGGVRRGQRGLIRIFLSQSDDPYCQATVLDSSWVWGIFQLQQGVETLKGDVERERAIELLGSGRAGLVCLMAQGIWRAIKRPTAHIFPPPPPRQCQLCIMTTALTTTPQRLLIYKGQTRDDNNNNRFVEMKNHFAITKCNFRTHLVPLTVKTTELRCLLFCSTSW